jgi:hypothetical protein
MILRACLVWLMLCVLAVLNGTVRTLWFVPAVGEEWARALSCISLSALILLLAWLMIGWLHPATPGEALGLGVLWLGLTLLFEFGAGHFLFGNSWEKLLADYNLLRGRLWIAVLVVTLFAPLWTARLRGLLETG